MKPTDIVKHVLTARFIAGLVVGALSSAGIIGPDWGPLLTALFGGPTIQP